MKFEIPKKHIAIAILTTVIAWLLVKYTTRVFCTDGGECLCGCESGLNVLWVVPLALLISMALAHGFSILKKSYA